MTRPKGRTLGDVDIGAWEAVEGCESGVHVDAMLPRAMSANTVD